MKDPNGKSDIQDYACACYVKGEITSTDDKPLEQTCWSGGVDFSQNRGKTRDIDKTID